MKAIVALFILAVMAFIVIHYNLGESFTLENLKAHQQEFNVYYNQHSLLVIMSFSLLYILSVAVSFPWALLLTLSSGAIFGLKLGVPVSLISASLGSVLSLLLSRYFFRDIVEKKFKEKLLVINQGIEKEGKFYLLTLRLIPVFPFFIINIVMGVTTMPAWTFFWVSMVGMIPSAIIYVNAGTEISKITTLKGILSPTIILSLFLLAALPMVIKLIKRKLDDKSGTLS
ncbi:MAG: TVP38/TMEM64 family protein [Rhizobacter sp.]|nr:TVP38/TMEM64 family protein [Bacteriovorax sp.]